MRSWYQDDVERHRAPAGTGVHGAASRNWSAAEKIDLTGCRMQETGSADATNGIGSVLTYDLIADLGADITAVDRIYWPAAPGGPTWFEAEGEPVRHRGITGATAHSITKLRSINVR